MYTACLLGSMSGEVAGRDHHGDNDDDEKGEWNRSIPSLEPLHSELIKSFVILYLHDTTVQSPNLIVATMLTISIHHMYQTNWLPDTSVAWYMLP